jgi:hypothetical protein
MKTLNTFVSLFLFTIIGLSFLSNQEKDTLAFDVIQVDEDASIVILEKETTEGKLIPENHLAGEDDNHTLTISYKISTEGIDELGVRVNNIRFSNNENFEYLINHDISITELENGTWLVDLYFSINAVKTEEEKNVIRESNIRFDTEFYAK